MAEPKSLPEVLSAVVLGPEDKLVVMVAPDTTEKTCAELAERLRALLGGDRVLVVGGSAVRGIAAIRATKAEGSTVGQCGDVLREAFEGATVGYYQTRRCHLAYDHTGLHSDGDATWSSEGSKE